MVKILLFESIILDEIFKCMQPMLSTMNTPCLVMQGNLLLCAIVTKLKLIFFLFGKHMWHSSLLVSRGVPTYQELGYQDPETLPSI